MDDRKASQEGRWSRFGAHPRSQRLLALIVLGLGLLAWRFPEATAWLAAFGALLLVLLFWPLRGDRAAAKKEAPRSAAEWPDAGMKAVVEAIGEPAMIVDRATYLRYRNPACTIAFGSMALGDSVSLRLRSPTVLAALERAIDGNTPTEAVLEERRSVDRIWDVAVLPIPAPAGESPRFFLVLFRDRTAERRTEQMRTDFVANASHELRTPLASLAGFIETLQGPARDDAAAREKFLAIMRDQAARMSRLIDDLLSLSRIEMKRHLPVKTPVDLTDIFRTVEDQITPLAEELGVSIELDLPQTPVFVAGEEDELLQVFSNLVENACKYGQSGGRVTLRVSQADERGRSVVDGSVTDYGPGIAPEHVPRLTERFYRVDVANSRSKRGTGLGLSIVRNILLRHKARLLVHSAVDEGSTFTARFPACDARSVEIENSYQKQKLEVS
ncbi:two-component system, OmpR family, phosphate regulon sensor histidine kinase PhoR [Fulvimarina manganoxydans]|uniref:histidine kinase n=1 Tax=Fulvimarina manganoxydans TaxID=937218 RepID=A0A1W2AVY1_9HYPH|nr:ATP-binding protein [Fulvimarina manganoxydans]SMC64843.1 two-component system, OmpR family, phosphate regulon sensor histidine kinase PhoR [Fulvimarina manganoxydans]